MNSTTCSASIAAAAAEAAQRIAPLWPLERFVAVNPFVGLVNRPFAEACALLERNAGAAPLLDARDYLALYDAGAITDAGLSAATHHGQSPAALHAALLGPRAAPDRALTLAAWLDANESGSRWAELAVNEVSKLCASYFDQNQTTWQLPWRHSGLYGAWREAARLDRTPEIAGLHDFRRFAATLPLEPEHLIAHAAERLGFHTAAAWVELFHVELLSIAGWAGYARYLAHDAQLRGGTSDAPTHLLAIRLAYDLALVATTTPEQLEAWRATFCPTTDQEPDARVAWQLAYEHGYHRMLAEKLAPEPTDVRDTRPSVQAVFCIDVRSEPIRRHLEAAAPSVQTLGFAGFFGFALDHTSLSAGHPTPRCPVLLAPQLETTELPAEASDAVALAATAKAVQNSAASCFGFVETLGAGFAPSLLHAAMPRVAKPRCERPAVRFDDSPAALDRLAATALGALRGMSLTRVFARVVLLCGHGSQTANNPHAASLACGACGGFAGDANARVAAQVFNHPGVRDRLKTAGINIPRDTWFVAALHDTLTDSISFLDRADVPSSHAADLEALEAAIRRAGEATRQEKAPQLGLQRGPSLLRSLRRRSADPAEVRPEWALANNAAIIVAPRERTRGRNLEGRAFLHEYDWKSDTDGSVLRLILSAPVVVASWINLQYYGSRVDPVRYGAGTKVLHNVAGGLGVFEGNGGDLRGGLPLQSLHDGERFRHEPRRLGVWVEAPRERLEAALAALPDVRGLFDRGWLQLFQLGDGQVQEYRASGWVALVHSNAATAEIVRTEAL